MDFEEISDYINTLDTIENRVVIYGIYKILHDGGVPCTKNENGRFYKSKDITGETFDKLVAYIKFSIHNRNILNQRQKLIEDTLTEQGPGSPQEQQPMQSSPGQDDTITTGTTLPSSQILASTDPFGEAGEDTEDKKGSLELVKRSKIANKQWQKMLKECRTDKKGKTTNKTQLEGRETGRLMREADQAELAQPAQEFESVPVVAPAKPASKPRKKVVKV